MTLTVLVPGGEGQVGSEVARLASAAGHSVLAPGSSTLDIRQASDVVAAVRSVASAGGPAVVVNCGAYTAVDAAESDERRAFAVNAYGPGLLAAVCAVERVPLVHISTDYVFGGDAATPYEPGDAVAPRSVYGQSKAAGEAAVLGSGADAWVVRTSWVYGAGGRNFVATMARLESESGTVDVVDDQHGTPTYAADLAAALLELAERISAGHGPKDRVLHCTNAGATTWFDVAREVFRLRGADPDRVRPCTTAAFPRPAQRPAYGVLSTASWRDAGLTPLRPWQEALAEFLSRTCSAVQK